MNRERRAPRIQVVRLLTIARASPWLAGVAAAFGLAIGCWDSDPCDPGQVAVSNSCAAAPPPPAGDDAGDGAAVGEGGAGEVGGASNLGRSCQTAADCSGDAPFCAQPFAPVCTQQSCGAGQANAGACPAGWQCLMIPGQPSVCAKM
jgi:hypothetical protein